MLRTFQMTLVYEGFVFVFFAKYLGVSCDQAVAKEKISFYSILSYGVASWSDMTPCIKILVT